MYIPFNKLPSNARVWVYQSNREFTALEIEYISKKSKEFINSWTRHGDALQGSFIIKHNQFLILSVNENIAAVSGCSIDSSVHFIKELQSKLNIDLLNKMNVAFKDNDQINLVSLHDFKKYTSEQKINSETIVFNNLIATKLDLENKWEIPVRDSWHTRFLV